MARSLQLAPESTQVDLTDDGTDPCTCRGPWVQTARSFARRAGKSGRHVQLQRCVTPAQCTLPSQDHIVRKSFHSSTVSDAAITNQRPWRGIGRHESDSPEWALAQTSSGVSYPAIERPRNSGRSGKRITANLFPNCRIAVLDGILARIRRRQRQPEPGKRRMGRLSWQPAIAGSRVPGIVSTCCHREMTELHLLRINDCRAADDDYAPQARPWDPSRLSGDPVRIGRCSACPASGLSA